MPNFTTLLVGSAMLALVAFLSWLTGLLMGFGVGCLVARDGGKHADVDELVRRQRAAGQNTRPAASTGAPGASQV